jgi:hypothetical protein
MSDHDIQIKRLAEAVTKLVNFVPETRDDLDNWYDQAQCILEDPELLRGAPHFLWHYLADSDIRMKSKAYAEMQNRRIELVLKHLKRGVMPSDEDTYSE